mmetsp:Transcript_17451/g.17285  ORF Transcript_17451/g.17285 Transcript_17451/m.17285 type:complete len:82 (-) Transcript_17451:117-362(-)
MSGHNEVVCRTKTVPHCFAAYRSCSVGRDRLIMVLDLTLQIHSGKGLCPSTVAIAFNSSNPLPSGTLKHLLIFLAGSLRVR